MMDRANHPILQLIHGRTSAESFQVGREIDEAEVRRLVEDATCAPSSFNIQHWRFVAVRSPEGKERLQQAAYDQRQVSRASVVFIVLGDTRGVERLPEILDLAVQRGALAEGKAAAWISMARDIYADPALARDEAIRSCSLAAMTMMLAAEARGLAVGALTGFDPQQVRREFAIGDRYVPVMLLAVGYPESTEGKRMPRLDVDEVLSFDHFRE